MWRILPNSGASVAESVDAVASKATIHKGCRGSTPLARTRCVGFKIFK